MPLPDFPSLDAAILSRLALRHGVGGLPIEPLAQGGIFNAIFSIGNHLILRVPREHPRFVGTAYNEAVAVPLAIAAGVHTPALVAFDASMEVLPVPYGIYERVAGTSLERASRDPTLATHAWQALGRDLARLHVGVPKTPATTALVAFDQKTDPRSLPAQIATAGYFGSVEAAWLDNWLDDLAPAALAPVPQRFLHGDSQAANIMVSPTDLAYRALIDWGGCRWGDVAQDFAGLPLRAVPAMLSGYREVSVADDTLEARILWRHLQIGLHQLRGLPQPHQNWAERPLAVLIEVLHFYATTTDPRWRRWQPRK